MKRGPRVTLKVFIWPSEQNRFEAPRLHL